MMENLKRFSPAVFALIIFCFFLPFVNLSCGGQKIMSLTGFQLITGTKVTPTENIFGDFPVEEGDKKSEVESQPMAVLSFILAIAGLAMSIIARKKLALASVIVSALGFLFMILLKVNMDSDIEPGGQYIITLDYQFGYWMTLLLFAAAAVIFWMVFKESEQKAIPSDIPPPETGKM